MTAKAIIGRVRLVTPGIAAGGAMRVDRLWWTASGSSDADGFMPIPVAEGETLVIWAWWVIPINSDINTRVYIDHEPVTPHVQVIESSFVNESTASFFTSVEGLSAGDHTVGLWTDGFGPTEAGGIIVMHVPSGSFFSQSRLGG